MWNDNLSVARLIASFCGCGFAPVAPGTVASMVTLLLGTLLLSLTPALVPATALLAVGGGIWAIRASGVAGDPSWIVIDEVAGQLLALCGMAHATLSRLICAFVVFRLLDVVKPGPIGWADRQHGAVAIMADDVIAGAITAGILWAIDQRWPMLLN
jgi:phosphatidylglycerophosphatase A